jgi:hypothetical protein
MGQTWEYLLAWAPLAFVVILWLFLRPRYSGAMKESLSIGRECLELQKKTLSCLEDIRAELKSK